jgi:hypothetical protein
VIGQGRTGGRAWVVPIVGAVLAANLAAFVFLVRPLASSSRGANDRAARAALALAAAERELASAEAAAGEQKRTKGELDVFYQTVLPGGLSAARQLTYASLPALAREHGVEYMRRRFDVLPASEDRRLSQLTIRMELEGRYEDLRRFIHEIERRPEFVVIDEITLAELDEAQPLALVITLSTFFPPGQP